MSISLKKLINVIECEDLVLDKFSGMTERKLCSLQESKCDYLDCPKFYQPISNYLPVFQLPNQT
jgi:hypothetical protein